MKIDVSSTIIGYFSRQRGFSVEGQRGRLFGWKGWGSAVFGARSQKEHSMWSSQHRRAIDRRGLRSLSDLMIDVE
jgi:hypothetical protein